jgi:LPS sulfotransferase NodH
MPVKFIVLAHFRSGSGLLCDLLNMHPEIHCDYEILDPFLASRMKPEFVLLFMKSLAARSDAPAYGCNIKLDQLQKVHPDPAVFLRDRHAEDWRFVYLRRRNLLRAALSNFIAARRQRYSVAKDDADAIEKTQIDCAELVNLLAWYQRIADDEAEALAGIAHLPLLYEDDLLDAARHQPALDRVFAFLGLASAPVAAKSARTSADDMAAYVANYDAVVDVVARTPYARYLDEA